MMRPHKLNPNTKDLEKAHFISNCKDFMMTMNKIIRKAAIKMNMEAPDA